MIWNPVWTKLYSIPILRSVLYGEIIWGVSKVYYNFFILFQIDGVFAKYLKPVLYFSGVKLFFWIRLECWTGHLPITVIGDFVALIVQQVGVTL